MTETPILHVDMDAFYASVEARDYPALAGVPLAVGGGSPRGVVMSASYEARAFGVRSAMPSVRARRLCPDLVFVPPDFERYTKESELILEILFSFTPLVEQVSLDEAFLDVSGAGRLFGTPDEMAGEIRARVRRERSLICSVGVAPNKLLAKLASEKAKPDGVVIVRPGEVGSFLAPLPVESLWGVGEQTARALHRLGARSVGELLSLPRGALTKALGPGPAAHLLDLAHGRDEGAVLPYEPAKQVSAEETFERDLDEREDLHREILRLASRVADRLRAGGIGARTVTLKVRFANFRTITRSRTLPEPTDGAVRIAAVAKALLDAIPLERPRIRLLGVAATGLVGGPPATQLRLVGGDDRWRRADGAVDRVRARFGGDAVGLAAISTGEGPGGRARRPRRARSRRRGERS